MTRYFAVGDIHGYSEILRDMIDLIKRYRRPEDAMVFTGDYLDRGPDSFEVIDILASLRDEEGHRNVFLRGNHDQELARAYRSQTGYRFMESVNDYCTVNSYAEHGQDLYQSILPANHKEFFANLWPCYDTEHIFFVHAGVDPNVPLGAQSEEDMLWIRGTFLNWRNNFPKMIVHGHSPTKSGEIEQFNNRVGIDVGIYHRKKLACGVFEDGRLVDTIYAKEM